MSCDAGKDIHDLIGRLRECSTYGFKQEICKEAADAIEWLVSENERLQQENFWLSKEG